MAEIGSRNIFWCWLVVFVDGEFSSLGSNNIFTKISCCMEGNFLLRAFNCIWEGGGSFLKELVQRSFRDDMDDTLGNYNFDARDVCRCELQNKEAVMSLVSANTPHDEVIGCHLGFVCLLISCNGLILLRKAQQ